MEDFVYHSPTKFVFGKETEAQCGALVKEFGGSKVLIHYGGGSVVRSGLLARVEASLAAADLPYIALGGVQPNPLDDKIYEGIAICKKEHIDFILALGGGSVIDSAKAIAVGALYAGDFWDFFTGAATMEVALPLGTVLTIAASGSEGSEDAVITKKEGMFKRDAGGTCIRPKFSVMNPELTKTLSPYQTACGITDMMAHVFERYFTNTKEVSLTDALCEGTLRTIIHEGKKAMANPEDYEARANLMWSGMIAHNNILGVGRAQDWSSHYIAHELSAFYDCAHGAALAVILPAWMDYVLNEKNHDIPRFAQMAEAVWGCTPKETPLATANAGILAFRTFLSSIGMPKNFQELGAKEGDISYLTETLIQGQAEIGGFVVLGKEEIRQVYERACK